MKSRAYALNPIDDVGSQKDLPTSFFPCDFYKHMNEPQNFLTFSFNPFSKLVQNVKAIPHASLKLLNLKQDHPSSETLIKLSLW